MKFFFRTGVFTPAQIIEEGRLKSLLAEYEEKMSNLSVSTKAMLEYILSFSELAKHVAFYFSGGLDTEKRHIVMQVFSELYISNGELKYQATEAFEALLMRYDASKTLSCGEREIRTPGAIASTQPFQGCRLNHSRISPSFK